VADHVELVVERGDAFRELLQNALAVNATLVAQQQNEEMRALTETSLSQNEEVKKISALAAILFAPTLVDAIYGMNFEPPAQAGVELRVSHGGVPDDRHGLRPVWGVQTPPLALTQRFVRSGPSGQVRPPPGRC
jgi:hypothetical protein